MRVRMNSKAFQKQMSNIIDYSVGFIDGVKIGKTSFLNNLGKESIDLIKNYVDSNARVDPDMLQHIYEWNQVGSPSGRLFDINYTVSNLGLSFKSSFSQSRSIKEGSKVPFYDKARIIEKGIPVTIRPKKSSVLVFNDNGEEVFTKKPVKIQNPGGVDAEGGFEKVLNSFFKYFSQSFLSSSGVLTYLENPVAYKKNISAGSRGGKAVGVSTGYKWIVNAGVIR